MSRGFYHIQICCGGCLGISDDLINFWDESIKKKMADGGQLKKNNHPKSLWARYLMSRWLDRIWILCSSSLAISNDLITFWEESKKTRRPTEHNVIETDITFIILDVDGQSLRLRGPAINWWLFFIVFLRLKLFLMIDVGKK